MPKDTYDPLTHDLEMAKSNASSRLRQSFFLPFGAGINALMSGSYCFLYTVSSNHSDPNFLTGQALLYGTTILGTLALLALGTKEVVQEARNYFRASRDLENLTVQNS